MPYCCMFIYMFRTHQMFAIRITYLADSKYPVFYVRTGVTVATSCLN